MRMTKIDLNSDIYSEDSVWQAISAYKGYANISMKSKNGYFFVTFSKCKYDEQRTVKEFENYLIGVENSK